MKRRDLLAAAVGGGAAVLLAPSAVRAASGSPRGARTNAALHWSAVAEPLIAAGRPAGSAGVLGGIVHAAIYDAAVAGSGQYRSLFASPSGRGRIDVDAAVATAAYLVLRERLPNQVGLLDGEYAAYLSLLENSPAKQRGVDVGGVVGEAVIAARTGDGLDAVVPWVQPTPGPGVFEPVAKNPDGTPATPVDVKLGRVRPLIMRSAGRFRPGGPNPLTSADYAADLNEVATYGRLDSAARDAAQTETARFWAEHTFTHWSRTLRRLATDQQLDTVAAARMLGAAHVAAADAVIGCFEAKYHYLFWRPVHAIERADSDGNDATTPDPTWRSLLTVNHPEYPSAHSTWSFAVTETLRTFFGTDRVPLTMSSSVTGTTRVYSKITNAAREVANARIWAGLHLRHSTEDGAALGRKVAGLVSDRLGDD